MVEAEWIEVSSDSCSYPLLDQLPRMIMMEVVEFEHVAELVELRKQQLAVEYHVLLPCCNQMLASLDVGKHNKENLTAAYQNKTKAFVTVNEAEEEVETSVVAADAAAAAAADAAAAVAWMDHP